MTGARAKKIMEALLGHYGRQSPPLSYVNLYQLTVAVVLSAQTTDAQVNAATPGLFARYPDFRRLAGADRKEVERLVKSTGFFRNKAAHIILLSQAIMERYGGEVPRRYEDLVSLPGVGRKSASVILLMGFGIPAFPVDTHIFRIGNRMGFAHSDKEIAVEEAYRRFIPEEQWKEAHLLLITHGRRTCRARTPLCRECVVRKYCEGADQFLARASR